MQKIDTLHFVIVSKYQIDSRLFFEYLEVTAIQKQDLRVVKAWRLVHKRV